ncbi:RING-H2 finger protein ATL70-like [Primulina huaijiensis]|uniref:RING-H2 finger protein ATL70-like n=1 Tax=Primulina huaijiensis TaxID=1492673 RepID=UPI003CC6F763
MNNTAAAGGFQNLDNVGYAIAISIGILFLIVTMTLASYCCTRNNPTFYLSRSQNPQPAAPPLENSRNRLVEVVLDESTLSSYPKMLFSEAKINHKDSTAACCSICLTDYENSDVLRVLPDCGHLFHLKCVDQWLHSHPTCPVCRTSPIPTPLAEVVPLAARPIG